MQSSEKRSRLKQQAGQMGLLALIVTIAIIAIVAGIMYPKIAGKSEYSITGDQVGEPSAMDRAGDASCVTYQSQINDAVTMYTTDHNRPPRSLQDLKQYGVTQEMIDTPNCNFVLSKNRQTTQSPTTAPAPSSGITVVNTGATSPAPYSPPPGSGPPPAPAAANNILPTKMGRSIPLDGGSARIERESGNGN